MSDTYVAQHRQSLKREQKFFKNAETPAGSSENVEAASIKSSSDKVLDKLPIDVIFVLIIVFDPSLHSVVASSWVHECGIEQGIDC
jgi:hypothetical protein